MRHHLSSLSSIVQTAGSIKSLGRSASSSNCVLDGHWFDWLWLYSGSNGFCGLGKSRAIADTNRSVRTKPLGLGKVEKLLVNQRFNCFLGVGLTESADGAALTQG